MKPLFAISLMILVLLAGCTDEPRSCNVLENSGYTEIEFTNHTYVNCGNNEFYHTGFRAKNHKGEIVFGTVCCGIISKGCRIVE